MIGEGRGWEGRGGERRREGGKGGRGGRGGRERRDECYTYSNGQLRRVLRNNMSVSIRI